MFELMQNTTVNDIKIAEPRDYYAEFISYLDVSRKTIDTYRKALKQWVNWTRENGITSPTRENVIAYRDALKETHKGATVNLYLGVVRLFFQWLEMNGIYKNVAQHIKGAKMAVGFRKDYLTSGHTRAIIGSIERKGIEGLRDYAIFSLMVTCGLRTVEVIRANIEDIRTVGDNRVLYVQGKGHSEKDAFVILAAPVETAIMAYLKEAGTPKEGHPLFRSIANRNHGGRLTTRSISRIVKERMKAAGYDDEKLTAHSLRHTAATLILQSGKTAQEAQQILRHKNINTTMIYAHNLDRLQNDGEKRVATMIFGETTAA